jgi:hypothetical protein
MTPTHRLTPPMPAHEAADKLRQIAALDAEGLQGWYGLLQGEYGQQRKPFDGELSAIMDRARKLGVTLRNAKGL